MNVGKWLLNYLQNSSVLARFISHYIYKVEYLLCPPTIYVQVAR